MGSAVHGRLEGGVIYTDAYLARVKAQLRGALRGALSPVSLTSLRRDLGLENLGALSALVPSLVEELRRGGAISGKSVAGSWVPASHSHAQQDAVRAFFQQNGYVTHAMAAKHGMPNAAQGLKGAFPDGLALGSAFVGAAVLHQVEAAVEEAVQSGTWCDVQDSVPSALDPEDAAQLLAQCKAAKGPGVKVLAETCAVSAALLDAMRAALKSEAADAARAAHASRKTAAGGEGTSGAAAAEGSGSKKKGGKGGPAAPAVEGDDSEDDWDTGKGKGKKGGKGGKKGKPAGKAADPPKPPAKGAAKGGQNDTSAATTAALSPDALHRRLVELYPDVDGAGVDGELPGAIVGEVRPAVVAEYERALAAIFTEGAEQRRRLRDAATARLTSSYEALQLHAHGAQLFSGDEGTLGVLQKHLMRTAAPACMDALLHFLAADAAEESENGDTTAVSPEEAVGVAFTPAQRAAAAKEAPAEAKAEVTSALDALSGASTTPEEFSDALQHAAGAVGLRLKHLDKKTEASKVAEQVALLQEQAMNAADAPTLLAVVVPLLVAKHRGRCVSLPGRALAPAVEMLKESLSEEEHEMLGRFHAAVVEQLRGEDRGAVLEELTAEVRKLVAG